MVQIPQAGSRDGAAQGQQKVARQWWLRTPVIVNATFSSRSLMSGGEHMVEPETVDPSGLGDLHLDVAAFTRPRDDGTALVTVSVVNRTALHREADRNCLFQARLAVRSSGDPGAHFLPYEESRAAEADPEEDSLRLLYRSARTFAVGHGCSADWKTADREDRAIEVRGECFPYFQAPSITPEILDDDKKPIEVPMAALAGLTDDGVDLSSLEELVASYESWILKQADRVPHLAPEFHDAAEQHLSECRSALERMRGGLAFLEQNGTARKAFRLANHAMLIQQLRTRERSARKTEYDLAARKLEVTEPFVAERWQDVADRGSWRPFQIAFVLTALESTALRQSPDRETVELIFFPTGGGKTEAYLCLSAFSMFYRRLLDPSDAGVDILMRYTLRLLTAQQFQRAGALVCAMEHLRKQESAALGEVQFSIGIWVGTSVSPNTRADARAAHREIEREKGAENKFVVLQCPWCRAQMGEIDLPRGAPKGAPRSAGYDLREKTVVLHCPDRTCEFNDELPIVVVDEDIYRHRPSLVIGTVDKFAMLAWKPEARALFGLGEEGEQVVSPPNLIIQDELHLISGPLGSVMGLYEGIIDDLCTVYGETSSKPKIVGSTATIRRSEAQVRDLYARTRTDLFPPRGLDAGDSFFGRYATEKDGELSPGRLYVGVHGAGLGSMQTAQVRTFASLLQAPLSLDPESRDPWWTLAVFFNSLRELGTSLSLIQSDIPDYLVNLRNRTAGTDQIRSLWNVLELTSRLRDDEVPKAVRSLEEPVGGADRAVDVCLASSIVEVGIDIDRLSLMCIVGQPKTTSQYIQVTGRVGRKWWERPGLVATIYSPSKPRDRSHFEQFRSYHERLYAQVEPTSVTPFSPPVLDRALHAVMVAYARQRGKSDMTPHPVPSELLEKARDLLEARVSLVDPAEEENLSEVFEKRYQQWLRWQRIHWDGKGADGDIPLLRRAGEYASAAQSQLSWSVPMSMRNVDAECRAEITNLYLNDEGEG